MTRHTRSGRMERTAGRSCAAALLGLLLISTGRPASADPKRCVLTFVLPAEGDPSELSYQQWQRPLYLSDPPQPIGHPSRAPIQPMEEFHGTLLDGYATVSPSADSATVKTALQLHPGAARYAVAVGEVVSSVERRGQKVDHVTVALNPMSRHDIGHPKLEDFMFALIGVTMKNVRLEPGAARWTAQGLQELTDRSPREGGEILLMLLADPLDVLVVGTKVPAHIPDNELIALEAELTRAASEAGGRGLFDLVKRAGRIRRNHRGTRGPQNDASQTVARQLGMFAAKLPDLVPGKERVRVLVGGRPFCGDHSVSPADRPDVEQGCANFRSNFLDMFVQVGNSRVVGQPVFLPLSSQPKRFHSRLQLTHRGLIHQGQLDLARCEGGVGPPRHIVKAVFSAAETTGLFRKDPRRTKH